MAASTTLDANGRRNANMILRASALYLDISSREIFSIVYTQ
jgi:hypothetical protein